MLPFFIYSKKEFVFIAHLLDEKNQNYSLLSFVACNNDTYGYQCSNLCACDKENTLDCDYVTGNCVCREHWNGNNCSTHVDDCLKGSAKCDPDTQRCAKRNGTESSFCVCLYGKNSTANGTCLCKLPLYSKPL